MRTADGRKAAEAILDSSKSTGSDRPGPTKDDDPDGVDLALEEAMSALDRKDSQGFKDAMRAAMRINHAAQSSGEPDHDEDDDSPMETRRDYD